jgi:regulation of enolase protein 1 (concanavalin A-like superfamily)
MKTLSLIAAATLATFLAPAADAQQALTIGPKHRYRFDNTSGSLAAGTQINDLIGTSHAFVRGSGASATGSGVRISGGSSATAPYIDLPNASVSGSAEMYPGLSEASFEVWVTVHSSQNWSRILDFGNNSIDEVAAPGGTFNGADYLCISANVGTANDILFERGGQYLTGGGNQFITGATTIGTRMHLVATYDTSSSAWKLYKNGTQIGMINSLLGPSTIDDLNVWLGRSNWGGDNNADATYDEFRIYDYALNTQQILGNYNAGPDLVTSDNQPPVFTTNPFSKPAATIAIAYSGQSISGSATDPDAGDTLTYSKTGGPSWLTVAANGSLSGTPPTGSSGTNAFTVRATDSGGQFAQATLNIAVIANQPPAFVSNPFTKPAASTGAAYSASLAGDASDPENSGALTFAKTGGPSWLTVASNGSLSGTPPAGTGGVNAFTIRATDVAGIFADATLNITVNNVVPSGWTASDIGATGLAGSSSESAGVYSVSGSGPDIWDTADAFQIASKTLTGDGEIRARVTSQANTDPWAKAGLMIRDGSAAGAVNAYVALTPSNGFTFQWRSTAASTSFSVAGPASNTAPNNWVRLTRSGTLVTAYTSANGTAWTQVGTTTLSMASTVSVGLAVTSHNNAALGTATFDSVSITPFPSPWASSDIGSTGLQGSAEFFGSAFTVKGAGTFGGTSDSFRYVYQTLNGNGTVIARVSGLHDTGTNARVGIMLRDTLAANSKMASLAVSGSGAWRWQRRTTTGGTTSTTNSGSGTAPNLWVRLVRSGSTITASRSTNGTSWTTIGNSLISMSTTCYVGLSVASGSTTTLNTSVIDNVSVTPSSPLLQPDQDLDSDDLPDAWETLFYTPAQYGPSDDADGDGQSNADEHVAGTNPVSGTDTTRLRILSTAPAVFEFNGKAGRSYALERMVSDDGSEWEQVQSTETFALDGMRQMTDSISPAGHGIYRLQIHLTGTP